MLNVLTHILVLKYNKFILQVEVSDSEEEQKEFIITESSEELQNIHKSSHQTEVGDALS